MKSDLQQECDAKKELEDCIKKAFKSKVNKLRVLQLQKRLFSITQNKSKANHNMIKNKTNKPKNIR